MAGVVRWIRGLYRELRRRQVIRVAVVYATTAFVILQLGEILVEPFGLGDWSLRLITLLLVLGFPLALGLAWVYNLTEEGVVREVGEGTRGGETAPHSSPLTSDGLIVGLLIVAIGLLLYPRLTGPADSSPKEAGGEKGVPADTASSARLGPRSVAVLPFTYLAAEDSTDYFSLGMTDELITRLSQVEDLPVIARTSVMQYRGTEKTIPEIGKELGVAHLVEGSVQKAGGKVRIQAQLIDAETGNHLWAEGFTRPFQDILDLQVDLARRIAGELKATLLPETKRQMAGAAQVDSTAYALYLQGRELRFEETGESLTRGVQLLRRSVSIDSTFAPAWATLSTAVWLLPRRGGRLPGGVERDSMARAAARRALELDSTSAEAHVAVGIVREVLDYNFAAAGPHFKRAVKLNSGLANAHREFGLYLTRMGRFEGAEHYLRKAARLDPASPAVFLGLGWNDLYRGNYKRAENHLRKVLELQPDYPGTRMFLAHARLGQGRKKQALLQIRQLALPNPSSWAARYLGWAYAQVGRPDSTRALLFRLQRQADSFPYAEGVLYAALGEADRALDLFEQAGVGHWVKIHPFFDPLRGKPRFQKMLEEMGLDEATVQQTMKKLDLEPLPIQANRANQTSGST